MTGKLKHCTPICVPILKVTFTLLDGTEEIWEFDSPDPTAFYRVSDNYKTKRGSSEIVELWKEHQLHWTSERMIQPKKE